MTSLPELETFLRERLTQALPGAEVQRRFAPRPPHKGWQPDQRPEGARGAAAIILMYPGEQGPTLPLTVRHSGLPHHPGQVSLPGGRVDPGETPQSAALREAHEEIGVDTSHVRIIGPLSSLWVIVSNFVVYPFVAVTDTRPQFALADGEVETLLEVPFADIRDAARRKWMVRSRDGVHVDIPHFDLAGHEVWGATAMILGELGALFEPDFSPPSLG